MHLYTGWNTRDHTPDLVGSVAAVPQYHDPAARLLGVEESARLSVRDERYPMRRQWS